MQIRRALLVVLTTMLFAGMTVLAQQQAPQQQAPQQQAPQQRAPEQQQPSAPADSTAKGELVRVDAKAKTITIKTADAQMVFTYSDDTKVTGVDDVAGLATLEGTDLTVTYTKRGSENIASKIEVQKKPAV